MERSSNAMDAERAENPTSSSIQVDMAGPNTSIANFGEQLAAYSLMNSVCNIFPESFESALIDQLQNGASWRMVNENIMLTDVTTSTEIEMGKDTKMWAAYCFAWMLVAQDKLAASNVPKWPGRFLVLEFAAAKRAAGLRPDEPLPPGSTLKGYLSRTASDATQGALDIKLLEAPSHDSDLQAAAGSSAQGGSRSNAGMELVRATRPDESTGDHSAASLSQTRAGLETDITDAVVQHWQIKSMEALAEIRDFARAHLLAQDKWFALVGALTIANDDIMDQSQLLCAEIKALGGLMN